jgi:biopolymer transport protein ExbB
MHAVEEFFLGEWYFALPLVLMSLVAGSLVIWRILLNMSASTDMDEFLPVFQQTLRKRGVKGALELCKEEKGLIPSRLFVAGLEASEQGAAAMRRSMANEAELDVHPRLHFLLAWILAIAKIATMVGLFFTVISMINTFSAIGEAAKQGGAKDVGGHSSKIGLALFATALGLFTAIPLVFFHVLFKDWIARFDVRMKSAAQKLVTLVTNYKKDPALLDEPEDDKKKKDDDRDRDDRDRDDDDRKRSGRGAARGARR